MADPVVKAILNKILGKGAANAYAELASPALDGAGAGGAVVTTGNGAWGAYKDLIAAGAVTAEFWVLGLLAYTPNQIQNWQLQLYNATQVRTLGNFGNDITAVTVNVGNQYLKQPVYSNPSDQTRLEPAAQATPRPSTFIVSTLPDYKNGQDTRI